MLKRILLASAMLAGGLLAGSAGALAASPVAAAPDSVRIVPAAVKVSIVYNPRIHGRRCRVRGGACLHFYNGYWYERPWWTYSYVAPVGPQVFVYDYRVHGPRYRYVRPGFSFYYGGYYYRRPWWKTHHM